VILWIAETSSGGADLKQTRPGAGIAADVGDVGGHMSANVDVDVAADVEVDVVVAAGVAADVAVVVLAAAAAADSTWSASASVNASGGAAGETILRCPWRPRGRVVVARQREAGSGSGRWDMTVGADRRWDRDRRR